MLLPIVPPLVTVNTGEENGPYQVMEEFFTSVLSFLGYEEHKAKCFAQREDRELTIFSPGGAANAYR